MVLFYRIRINDRWSDNVQIEKQTVEGKNLN